MIEDDKRREEQPPHKILKEVLRNYLSYQDHLTYQGGSDVIEHSYFVYDDPDAPDEPRKVSLTISFSDLKGCLKPQSEGGIISERKREALLYYIVFDMKQKDVAERMGISPVSVGQYADLALRQLARRYFTTEDLIGSDFDYGSDAE